MSKLSGCKHLAMGHTLSLLETSPYPQGAFRCNLCQEKGCGPVYHCSDCDFDVHVSCAATAEQQTHFTHPHHPLHLSHCGSTSCKCDSCGFGIRAWSFRCEICDFDIHSMCARAPRFIKHPQHLHPLGLSKSDNLPGLRQCNGCKMPTSDLVYQCHSCQYVLHQACATLPTKIKHVKHQAHMLTLVNSPLQVVPICNECRKEIMGWRFHCGSCNKYNLHPCCANLVHELPHFNVEVNASHARTTATSSVNTSTAHQVLHDPIRLTLQNVSHTSVPDEQDWESVERVLRFAREMAKGSVSHAAQGASPNHLDDEQDHCPTCLEGFDSTDPKKITGCGHYFHLACILEWMERSTDCPVCRKRLEISM